MTQDEFSIAVSAIFAVYQYAIYVWIILFIVAGVLASVGLFVLLSLRRVLAVGI